VRIDLDDVHATENLGAYLATLAKLGDVFFLIGELGAGKTALARGFLRSFFQKGMLDVPSPSYLISLSYGDSSSTASIEGDKAIGKDAEKHQTWDTGGNARIPGVTVYHCDPYRLAEGKVAALLDFPNIFEHGISLIEWPNRLGPQLVTEVTPPRLEVVIEGMGPQAHGRTVTLKAVGLRWEEALARYENAGMLAAGVKAADDHRYAGIEKAGEAAHAVAKEMPTFIPPGDPKVAWPIIPVSSPHR